MLGDNIKKARQSKCMTQEELATRLNVVRQTVSKWEKNLSVPDADLLEKLADILGTDVRVLLGGEESICDAKTAEDRLEFITQQLAKMNEREAEKMRARRRAWITVGIVFVTAAVIALLWYAFGRTTNITWYFN